MKESSKFIPNSAHFPNLCRIIGIVLVLVTVGIIHPPELLCAEPGDLVPPIYEWGVRTAGFGWVFSSCQKHQDMVSSRHII